VKGARELLEVERKATIIIDSDNTEMLKAIENNLTELKFIE